MEETKRLFIGNLPDGITDSDVRRQFGGYGKISSLEIKTKKGVDGKAISTFAFVDLIVSGSKLSQCLNNTDGSDVGGNRIRVQIAKESFMDKLKAEREQSNNKNASSRPDQTPKPNPSLRMDYPSRNNNSIKFDAPLRNNVTKFDDKGSYDPLQMIRSQKASVGANKTSSQVPESHKSFDKSSQKQDSWKKPEKPAKKVVSSSESSSDDSSDSDEETVITSKKPTIQKKKSSLMSELENYSGMWNDLDSKPVEVERRDENTFEADRRVAATEKTVEEVPKEQSFVKPKIEDSRKPAVIDENSKKKELDNQKRIQSLQERSKALQARTIQIQSALSSTDKKMNRKIVFDEDDDEEAIYNRVKRENTGIKTKKSNLQLFDEEHADPEDIDDADQFKLRPHLDGSTGKELLELQSRFGNDSRFKLDSRFRETSNETKENRDGNEEYSEELDEEKDRQMSILSSLVPLAPSAFKKDTSQQLKSKAFVRFDPKVQEHSKFEKEVQKEAVKEGKKKGRKDDNYYAEQAPAPLPEVSSERYYTTTTALNIGSTQSGGGFSLRSLFQAPEQEAEELVEETQVAPTTRQEPVQQDRQDKAVSNPDKRSQATGYWKNAGMWHETLFLQPSDARFKEALNFIFKKTDDEHYRDRNLWPDHRDRLMRFYKNKMRRSTSSHVPGQKRTLETADESGHLYKAQPDPRKKPRKTFYKK